MTAAGASRLAALREPVTSASRRIATVLPQAQGHQGRRRDRRGHTCRHVPLRCRGDPHHRASDTVVLWPRRAGTHADTATLRFHRARPQRYVVRRSCAGSDHEAIDTNRRCGPAAGARRQRLALGCSRTTATACAHRPAHRSHPEVVPPVNRSSRSRTALLLMSAEVREIAAEQLVLPSGARPRTRSSAGADQPIAVDAARRCRRTRRVRRCACSSRRPPAGGVREAPGWASRPWRRSPAEETREAATRGSPTTPVPAPSAWYPIIDMLPQTATPLPLIGLAGRAAGSGGRAGAPQARGPLRHPRPRAHDRSGARACERPRCAGSRRLRRTSARAACDVAVRQHEVVGEAGYRVSLTGRSRHCPRRSGEELPVPRAACRRSRERRSPVQQRARDSTSSSSTCGPSSGRSIGRRNGGAALLRSAARRAARVASKRAAQSVSVRYTMTRETVPTGGRPVAATSERSGERAQMAETSPCIVG